MIIYYVCAVDISNFDAQRTHVLEVASELQNLGVQIELYLPQFLNQRESFPFITHYISVWFKTSRLKFIEYELRLFFILLMQIIKKRPHIVYIRKGFITIIPTILSRLSGIPSILEVNGFQKDELQYAFGLSRTIANLFGIIEKYNCRLANKIITVTEGLQDLLISYYMIDSKKIAIIPNGVNAYRFAPEEKTEDGNYYLGFVGNLVPWSGLEFLIRSIPRIMQRYKNVRYLIVGDGIGRESLEKLTESLGLTKYVIFTGVVNPEKVPEYLNRCHICFIPAMRLRNYRIGVSPIKLYEYMACGIPVIVTKIKGMEIVEQHGIGLMVEPEDSNALAEATIKLLNSPELRRKMSTNARELAIKEFTWVKSSQRILSVCQSLLD